MKKVVVYCLLLITYCCIQTSCKKDSFITSNQASVDITTDSLKYDTVFTTTGSITKSFKIINENNQKLLLNTVKLMGGISSAYKINVNGVPPQKLVILSLLLTIVFMYLYRLL